MNIGELIKQRHIQSILVGLENHHFDLDNPVDESEEDDDE